VTSSSGPAATRVLVVLGSDSDLPMMGGCVEMLKRFGIGHDVRICSAHRSPRAAHELAAGAREAGYGVVIAAAGGAAHLAGTVAALTTLPVIGVPIATPPLNGVDALYATVQMPPGVPVATVAVGEWGARNAGVLAAQILSLGAPALEEKLRAYKQELADGVAKKDKAVRASAAT
jgi:phosphoribosylaminoimidazole carboxylase PurE protein